jgi:hypothetical protein
MYLLTELNNEDDVDVDEVGDDFDIFLLPGPKRTSLLIVRIIYTPPFSLTTPHRV